MRSLVEMLPRLQAEETLTAAHAHALGAGTLKKSDASSARADLLRRARQGRRPRPLTDQLDIAAALGFTVEKG